MIALVVQVLRRCNIATLALPEKAGSNQLDWPL